MTAKEGPREYLVLAGQKVDKRELDLAREALDAVREMFGLRPLASETNALANTRGRRRVCRVCGRIGHNLCERAEAAE